MRSEFFGQWMVSIKLAHRKPRSPLHKSSRSAPEVVWNVSVSSRTGRGEDTEDIWDYPWGNLSHRELPRQNYKKDKECFWAHVNSVYRFSLRKQSFLLSPRRRGHLARRNVCDSLTEIPHWWRKICPESGQKSWLVKNSHYLWNIFFSRRSIWVLLELVRRRTQHFTKIEKRKIEQICIRNPMTIYYVNIDLFSAVLAG